MYVEVKSTFALKNTFFSAFSTSAPAFADARWQSNLGIARPQALLTRASSSSTDC